RGTWRGRGLQQDRRGAGSRAAERAGDVRELVLARGLGERGVAHGARAADDAHCGRDPGPASARLDCVLAVSETAGRAGRAAKWFRGVTACVARVEGRPAADRDRGKAERGRSTAAERRELE